MSDEKPAPKKGHDVITPDKGYIDINQIFDRMNATVKEEQKVKEKQDG